MVQRRTFTCKISLLNGMWCAWCPGVCVHMSSDSNCRQDPTVSLKLIIMFCGELNSYYRMLCSITRSNLLCHNGLKRPSKSIYSVPCFTWGWYTAIDLSKRSILMFDAKPMFGLVMVRGSNSLTHICKFLQIVSFFL